MCLRGEGMNNYWNHEPEFFWYKKKSEKSEIFYSEVTTLPPRLESISWKNSRRHFFTAPKGALMNNNCLFKKYDNNNYTKKIWDVQIIFGSYNHQLS